MKSKLKKKKKKISGVHIETGTATLVPEVQQTPTPAAEEKPQEEPKEEAGKEETLKEKFEVVKPENQETKADVPSEIHEVRTETMPENPETATSESSNKFLFYSSFLMFFGIALVSACIGFFLLMLTSQPKPTKSTLVLPDEKKQVVKKPVLNKSDWNFEVLNGSGIPGEAKKAAEKLQSDGYNVIIVGNAEQADYEGTQVFIESDKTESKDLLITDLTGIFPGASYSGELTDSTASARIIIGK